MMIRKLRGKQKILAIALAAGVAVSAVAGSAVIRTSKTEAQAATTGTSTGQTPPALPDGSTPQPIPTPVTRRFRERRSLPQARTRMPFSCRITQRSQSVTVRSSVHPQTAPAATTPAFTVSARQCSRQRERLRSRIRRSRRMQKAAQAYFLTETVSLM